MRRAIRLLLFAGLFLASPHLLSLAPGLSSLESRAAAQTMEVGGGARVAAAPGRRVNVRAEPEVRSGNVVAAAEGGDLLMVVERAERQPFDWYRIETLDDAPVVYQGWIRGDLLEPAPLPTPTPATVPAPAAERPAEVAPASEPAEPAARLPLKQRTDWSRDLIKLYPAIRGCVMINSAPPVTVLRSTLRGRGLAEVIMADDAGRRWDCIISDTGGTPIRYDPLSGAPFPASYISKEPFFQIGAEPPQVDPACHEVERIVDPESAAHLGWLYYRTCP